MRLWKFVLLEGLSACFELLFLFSRPFLKFLTRILRLSNLRSCSSFPIPASTQFDGFYYVDAKINLLLGEYCRLGRNVLFETNGQAKIVLGNRVRINDGSVLAAHEGITIGDDTLIGEYVSIRDANHGMASGELIRILPHEGAVVTIGRDVWIGRGACVLKGVSIGDGAIVGANSVVTRDVAAGLIVAGVPARPVGVRGSDK